MSEKPKLKNGWKYIEEEQPPEGQCVFVTNNLKEFRDELKLAYIWMAIVHKDKDNGFYAFTDSMKISDVVAWHPLPGKPV